MKWSQVWRHALGFMMGCLSISFMSFLPQNEMGTSILLSICFLLWFGFNFCSKSWRWTLLFLPAAGSIALALLKRSHFYPHYLFTVALAYLFLLSLILMLFNRWLFKQPYSLKIHFQKRYLLYGFGCFALLWATTTMDKRDPLGPHFQLQVMVWILFFLMLVNWLVGHFKWIKSLETAKSEAELSNLKNQIHPHFLFNTLNNIYGLAREKSDLAPEMILKLSDLLRYSVHHANHQQVPLEKEVEHLQNFLDLQSLRYHDLKCDAKFEVQDQGIMVPPLIFLPLVENAFKHGVDLMPQARVEIRLNASKNKIDFSVVNDRPKTEFSGAKGTGLTNLKRRLELNYSDRHRIRFEFASEKARAELELRL